MQTIDVDEWLNRMFIIRELEYILNDNNAIGSSVVAKGKLGSYAVAEVVK